MILTINSKQETFSEKNLTLAELVSLKNISPKGTAIALNGRIAKAPDWEITRLKDGDTLTIISAAYGG